jgi:hypothetical protein
MLLSEAEGVNRRYQTISHVLARGDFAFGILRVTQSPVQRLISYACDRNHRRNFNG